MAAEEPEEDAGEPEQDASEDLGDESEASQAPDTAPYYKEQLLFASKILGWLLIFTAAVLILYLVAAASGRETAVKAGSEIFEFAKSFVPPLFTLIIGYYFSRK